jgi:ABC-type Mn2+/Zn2+ transport system ATPase subunit
MVDRTRVNVNVEEMRDEEVRMRRMKRRLNLNVYHSINRQLRVLSGGEKQRRGKLWHFL